MTVNEYLQKHKKLLTFPGISLVIRECTPRIICADGFSMSVQVGEGIYCSPRVNDAALYTAAEVGFPLDMEPLLMEYAESPDNPTGTVYPWVPIDVIEKVIEKHGGMEADDV